MSSKLIFLIGHDIVMLSAILNPEDADKKVGKKAVNYGNLLVISSLLFKEEKHPKQY